MRCTRIFESIYAPCNDYLLFFCCPSMIPITHRHCNNFYIIHWPYTPHSITRSIMYDLSLLFLLSFSFIFHMICEDFSPSYTCINQRHLAHYNVSALLHHLVPLIMPSSCVFSSAVIILLPASLVLRLWRFELMLADIWYPPESFLDKHCPLNIWSESEALPSSNGRISHPLPLQG